MIQKINSEEPIFPIRTAAKLLDISVHTLRMYEREGLVLPFKKDTNHRLYSKADLERIQCIRNAINESKISINGIKSIYALIPCWKIVKCSEEDQKNCSAYNQHAEPCWKNNHPNTVCEFKECRECNVYKDFARCGEIKELIKSISR